MLSLTRAGPPGTAFQVAMAGFQPGQLVPVHLYFRVDGAGVCDTTYCWPYAAALDPALIDARGEALYTLPTKANDPEGSYALDTEPRVLLDPDNALVADWHGGAVFVVER